MQPAVAGRTKQQARRRVYWAALVALTAGCAIATAICGVELATRAPAAAAVPIPSPVATPTPPCPADGSSLVRCYFPECSATRQTNCMTIGTPMRSTGTTTISGTTRHEPFCADYPVFAGRTMTYRRECH